MQGYCCIVGIVLKIGIYSTRIINLGVIAVCASLISVLYLITPSELGLGTHQQFIPVPCLFLLALKVPCPSCGLTTSLSFLLHGQLINSLKAHPLGPAFLALFILMIVQSIRGLIRNRAWWVVLEKRWFQNFILCGIGVYLGIWMVRLIF